MESLLPFDQVYAENAEHVFRFCLSQLGDVAAAEDATSAAFLRALQAYERARPIGDGVQSWMLRIARNVVLDIHRSRQRWRRLLVPQPPDEVGLDRPSGEDVERDVVADDEMRALLEVLRKLSPRDQLLIGLRCAADLPYRRVAEVAGLTEEQAMTATRRAIKRLRKLAGPEWSALGLEQSEP